jgi:hypothetical protein
VSRRAPDSLVDFHTAQCVAVGTVPCGVGQTTYLRPGTHPSVSASLRTCAQSTFSSPGKRDPLNVEASVRTRSDRTRYRAASRSRSCSPSTTKRGALRSYVASRGGGVLRRPPRHRRDGASHTDGV